MFKKKSFLEECKKTFNKHNLILYQDLYPICLEDLRKRKDKYGNGGYITDEQKKVGLILFENNIPFIFEHKIESAWNNDFWCDIYAKGNYHFFDIEIDGEQHNIKQYKIRDLKKEIFLMDSFGIITERITNDVVNNNPKKLKYHLEVLKTKFHEEENKLKFIKESLGQLKCDMCDVKSKKN